MPSENNHIDNFFHQKASEAMIDERQVNTDWQQMQRLLVKPGIQPVKRIKPRSRIVRYTAYAAGVAVIVTAITLKSIQRKKADKINTPVVTTKGLPAIDQPVTKKPGPERTNVITPVMPKKQVTAFSKKDPGQILTVKDSSTIHKNPISKIDPPLTIKPDSRTVFNNFYNELKKPAQEFVINTQRDTTIRCKEGTSLFIPAHSFQTLSGLAITGIVKMYVQEFYSYADILGNKLSTTSNGVPIETAGMINLNATSGNEVVKIRTGAALDLKMPARAFQADMQLFIGEQAAIAGSVTLPSPAAIAEQRKDLNLQEQVAGGINWIANGQQQYFYNESKKIISILNLRNDPSHVRQTNKRTVAKFAVAYNCRLSNEEVRQELQKRYGKYYDAIKVKREWKPLWKKNRIRFVHDWYLDYYLIGDSINIPLPYACRIGLVNREDSLQFEEGFKKKLEEAIKQKRSYEEFIQVREAYNFKIQDLGWINCDRFLNYPRTRLTDIVVQPGKGFEGSYFQAMLIFEKEKTAMPGYWNEGKVVFPNLPVGHSVNLVCTGVKDGKMFTSIQNIKVDRFKSPELIFEETSPVQFREKLARFGTVK